PKRERGEDTPHPNSLPTTPTVATRIPIARAAGFLRPVSVSWLWMSIAGGSIPIRCQARFMPTASSAS
ncbi:MAG: hypothetical protein WD060_13880, partial [Pirellulales bacterium]